MVGNWERQRFGTARDPRRLDDLVEKFGAQVRSVPLDVADESAAQAAVQVALDAFGRLDVVVNNAGFGDIAPFEQLSGERFNAVMDTNFYGVVNVSRAAVPIMRKQRSGCILQVAQVVLRLAASDILPAHLLIGSDAVRFAAEAEKTRAAEAAQWREVSLSTDVASSTALLAMRF